MRMEASNKIGISLPKKKVYIVVSRSYCGKYESYDCIEKVFMSEMKAEQYSKECEERNIFNLIYEYEVEE